MASVSIYGYCIGVWLVVRQGRRGMARAKARVQGCGYVVGIWCRGMVQGYGYGYVYVYGYVYGYMCRAICLGVCLCVGLCLVLGLWLMHRALVVVMA